VRDILIYGSYRLLASLTGPLPPQAGYALAERVGPLIYALLPSLRRTLIHNIRHVLGPEAEEEQVQTLARQACVHIAKGHYDLFRLERLSNEDILRLITLEGMVHLEEALAAGQGVVAFSAHFGNVDVVAQLPLVYGVPATTVVQHIHPEQLFRYLLRVRQSHGLHLIPTDGPMLGLYRALKRGEIVALPLDWNVGENTRPVEFFGVPAHLPEGAVRVALRTGAALVPIFALRLPDNSFLVRIEPSLEIPRSGDREADVTAGMRMAVAVMERYIAEHPEQWLVGRPVWPMDT